MDAQAKRNLLLRWILPASIALLVLLLIRLFIIFPIRIGGDTMPAPYILGRIAWVSRVHTPLPGRVVLFHAHGYTADSSHPLQVIGRVVAAPGDKLYVDPAGLYINGRELPNHISQQMRYHLQLPHKGEEILLNEVNLVAYREAIHQELGTRASFSSGALFVDGHRVSSYVFLRSYYWILADKVSSGPDSRHIGIVSDKDVQGVFIWPSEH